MTGVGILLTIVLVLVGLIVLVASGALITRHVVRTPALKSPDGTVLPGSIAEFRRVRIGGCSQALLIRGKSTDNPVLLFLHAGPGMSEMGICRNVNADLEDHYIVVHWDQRGAGKSYSPFISSASMTVDQVVQDTHELTQYLKKRFGKDRIVLVGHSWGACLGLVVAAKYPSDYSAVVCIGQQVIPLESDRLSYGYTLEQARKTGNTTALKELERIDGYWRHTGRKYVSGMMIQKRWVQYFGGMLHGRRNMSVILKKMLSREVTIFDFPAAMLGSNFSIKTLAPRAYPINLKQDVPELHVPYILMQGRHDTNSYPSLIEEYVDMVQAPAKRVFWFENSAHWPHVEEPDLFHEIMASSVPAIIAECR